MNLQQQEEFFQMMTRVRGSRAASLPKEDTIVTEIVEGLIVSKPAKRIEHISASEANPSKEAQAQVWNLTRN